MLSLKAHLHVVVTRKKDLITYHKVHIKTFTMTDHIVDSAYSSDNNSSTYAKPHLKNHIENACAPCLKKYPDCYYNKAPVTYLEMPLTK